ncbi:hypothetical protein ZEAMMB73_Zm00001d014254 [Zea mays]|uniref:Uncharacterized protein n=1 Tax=Zea mays TaxID=4577 RepID=A0A1D6GR82_MAIZE|nr:hypothetical protein ZEAMMB73_Zm00001d014254 [Zea mays]
MVAEGETVALEFTPIAERCLQYLGKTLKKKAASQGQRRCPISSYFCFDTYHRRSHDLIFNGKSISGDYSLKGQMNEGKSMSRATGQLRETKVPFPVFCLIQWHISPYDLIFNGKSISGDYSLKGQMNEGKSMEQSN